MSLSQNKQKREYLERKGEGCLYCDAITSRNKQGDLPLPGDDVVVQLVTCKKCGRQWRDVYTITDVEELKRG